MITWGLVKEVWEFLGTRKKWWLTAIMFLLIVLGALMVLGQSSVVAPLIYTLF